MNVMTRRGSLDNVVTYQHVCDTVADLQNIPLNQSTLGSTAIVLRGESGDFEVYIAKSNGKWMLISMGSGSSSGGNGGTDTSQDTVTAADLLEGVTAHDRNGAQIIGEIINRTIADLQETNNTLIIPQGYYSEEINYKLPVVLPTAQENDVIFIDYDGTIRYSYTKEEFLALNELPPNPTHIGLTAQGWNWTLTDAKQIMQARSALAIGQNYITSDGKTRIYIDVPEDELQIGFCITLKGTALIEWGDETTTELTTQSKSVARSSHTYNSKGHYIISVTVTGAANFEGSGSTGSNLIINPNYAGTSPSYFFLSLIKKIELGENMTIGYKGLMFCDNLQSVAIPLTGFASRGIAAYSFEECPKLKALVIPPTIRYVNERICRAAIALKYCVFGLNSPWTINIQAFEGCTSLQGQYLYLGVSIISEKCFAQNHFQFFEFMTSIQQIQLQAFYQARWLKNITFPTSLATIGEDAFYSTSGLSEIHFKRMTPPQIVGSTTFQFLPQSCKIYVPTGTLSAYTAATNYPDPSIYTYLEE